MTRLPCARTAALAAGYLRSFGVLAPAEARTGTLEGPAVCEVFPDAKWPEGQPRKYGLLKPEEMRPSRATLEAIAKAHGSSEFQVIKQSENTGGVDVVVGPGRNAQAYQDFQNRWKVRLAGADRGRARAAGGLAVATGIADGIALRRTACAHRSSRSPGPALRAARRLWIWRCRTAQSRMPSATRPRPTERRCRASMAASSDGQVASFDQ